LPLLITAFLREIASENNRNIEGIDDKARARLFAYDWPGNVRELRNCIESAVVMSRGPLITEDDLPPTLRENNEAGWIRIPVGTNMAESEKIILRDTLSAYKGNKTKASEVLGIGRKTMHRKLVEYKLDDGKK